MIEFVNPNRPPVSLPKSAITEFEKVGAKAWGGGIALEELLARVNRVASRLRTRARDRDSRVSATFQERSFRHYQTLGCLDPGERAGRRVVYGFRHFVQALLIRRLLWQRLPVAQIAGMMDGRSTAEIEQMFLGGVEVVPKGKEGDGEAHRSRSPLAAEVWKRITVVPGVELHMRDNLPEPGAAGIRELLEQVEEVLLKWRV